MNNPLQPFQLTQRWEDLSTETHVQFRFYCDSCEEHYTSHKLKKPDQRHEKQQWDDLFTDLKANFSIHFSLCLQCKQYVCREFCWNPIHNRCENCLGSPFATDKQRTLPATPSRHCYSSILGPIADEDEKS